MNQPFLFLFLIPVFLFGCTAEEETVSICRKTAEVAKFLKENGSPDMADALLETSGPCEDRAGDETLPREPEALFLWMMDLGDSLQRLREPELANQLFREADTFFTGRELWNQAFLARIRVAATLPYPDKEAEALGFPLFDETIRQIRQVLGDSSALLPKAYHAEGLACINNYYDRDVQATRLFHRERELLETYHPDHWDERLTVYVNLGMAYSYLEMLDSSLFYLNRFREGLPNKKDLSPITEQNAWQLLARGYQAYGDLDNVETPLQLVINHYAQSGDSVFLGFAYNDMAILKRKLKRWEEGLKYGRLAVEQLEGKEGYETDLANCFYTLGFIYMEMDELEPAKDYLLRALRIYEEDSAQRANTYNTLSIALKRSGRYEEAMDTLEKAIAFNQENEDRLNLFRNYDNKGDLLVLTGDLDGALQAYQRSIQFHVSGFEPGNVFDNPVPDQQAIPIPRELINPLSSKAKTLYLLYRNSGAPRDEKMLKASYETYLLIDQLLDEIRSGYTADKSKESLAADTKAILENAIEVSLELYELTAEEQYLDHAFSLAEKGKALVLLDAVRFSRAKDLGLSEADREEEKQLSLRLAYLQQKLITGTEEEASALIGELAELKIRRQRLLNKFSAYPKYARYLENRSGDPLSIAEVRRELLQEDQALIEYFRGEDQLIIFTITAKSAYYDRAPLDADFSLRIDQMREGIYRCRLTGTACSREDMDRLDEGYAQSAADLYEALIAPLEAHGLPEKLLIIPDGKLGYLPFEALLSERPRQTGAYQSYAYLLDRYTIHYAYSASLVREMKNLPVAANRMEALAFAPSFSGNIIPETGEFLGDLKQNTITAQEAERLFGGAVFKGRKARKGTFIEKAPDYRYLILATHGVTFDEDPDRSFVAFSQDKDTLDLSETLLLQEIYPLELNADLVVLSACNTSLGKLADGEGIISLARSFSYAGSKCLVTTLWSVGDEASTRLLSHFFENLGERMPKDEALLLAKRQLREMKAFNYQYAHPYFWAGYIAIGDTQSIGGEEG